MIKTITFKALEVRFEALSAEMSRGLFFNTSKVQFEEQRAGIVLHNASDFQYL